MSAQIVYHKWQPQKLSEVVGQEYITQTLRNIVKKGIIAPVYLFCGPSGTGKTSVARIFAKMINCNQLVEYEPCNKCAACKSIDDGSTLDLLEINAHDLLGQQEITKYIPAMAKYKVFIINNAHNIRLSIPSFIKTLENPPPYVVFIFETITPQKINPFILSRSQRFDFKLLSQEAIASKLDFICQKEGISIEQAALWFIARRAAGNLRDAENLLEQAITYCDHPITLNQILKMLGIINDSGSPISKSLATNAKPINGKNTIVTSQESTKKPKKIIKQKTQFFIDGQQSSLKNIAVTAGDAEGQYINSHNARSYYGIKLSILEKWRKNGLVQAQQIKGKWYYSKESLIATIKSVNINDIH